ncbi:hypothetical protein B0H11DRAFT_2223528 [Mycena galericulata]|nr:hypothetical protein B0H11DRAFT_2223528 [Mycena galericulata]
MPNVSKKLDPSLFLPPELLSEIFHLCGPFSNGRYLDGLSMRDSPWLMTHVCRRWREAALSTPMLWRLLSIDISIQSTQTVEGIFQLVSLFLERAAHCSISVVISGRNGPQHGPIFERLMSTSDRWEDLRIFAPGRGTLVRALSPIRGHLPRLRHLEVHREDAWLNPISSRIDTFSSAPRLQHAVFAYDPSISFILPWTQLSEYKTSYCEVGLVLNTLRELVNLVTLTLIRLDLEGEDTPEQPRAVHLPRLRTLSLTAEHDSAEDHPGDLLEHLFLPVLANLALDGEAISLCPHLTALIERSGCAASLESLTLTVYDTLDVSICTVLASTPALTDLSLSGLRVDDDILTELARAEPALVPRLAALTLRDVQFNQQLLLRLINSRCSFSERAFKQLRMSLAVVEFDPVLADGVNSDMELHVELLH